MVADEARYLELLQLQCHVSADSSLSSPRKTHAAPTAAGNTNIHTIRLLQQKISLKSKTTNIFLITFANGFKPQLSHF